MVSSTAKIASYVMFETLGNFCCGKFVLFVKSVVIVLRNASTDCFTELAKKNSNRSAGTPKWTSHKRRKKLDEKRCFQSSERFTVASGFRESEICSCPFYCAVWW